MTSPSTPEEPGHDRAPGADAGDPSVSTTAEPAGHAEPARSADQAEPARSAEPIEPAEQAQFSEPGAVAGAPEAPDDAPAHGPAEPGREPAEARPATGIRWGDRGHETPAADDDATPPSGFHVPPAPGEVVPDRTTGAAPSPPPGAAWPHPGYQQGAPPTWPPTAPAWAPAPPPRDPARRRRIRRLVLLGLLALLVVAAVVVLLLAFLVGPRFARYDVLDHAAVERGVTDVVTRDWHRQITGVSCPDGERVRPGTSFTCAATVDGKPQQVPVDVVDENGTYEVGQPR
ncbi:DUF4333 domain-containing protein [Actinomycetospora sp. TBRC 11914]|uniref:DUF4333 domain-containing protein n=1 Tax=Actinomycetospora sp. TBRC 11914 TaxID=2729387 RepID=UPI00145CA6C7|nr:DUF4333 domain-containing protein [Actinomycetospora sp. TBRC 11914]NMO92853.1 DUF4333 domain-containing protein [Actinomycetospora sp. TBRC 11914]